MPRVAPQPAIEDRAAGRGLVRRIVAKPLQLRVTDGLEEHPHGPHHDADDAGRANRPALEIADEYRRSDDEREQALQ